MAFWSTCLYFDTYILDSKLGFHNEWAPIGEWCKCFKWIFGHFMIIFSCFWSFFAAYLCNFCTFVVCLLQFLPFLSNLQVNFNELTIIYPTVLFPPNICIANLVLGLDDILDTWQLIVSLCFEYLFKGALGLFTSKQVYELRLWG